MRLDVPFSETDPAKAAGGRWNRWARRWDAPAAGMEGLESRVALPDVPDPLPDEDSGFGDGLFVDLVLLSCWFTNVRTCVDRRDWERLRHTV